ncbi:unnamed protein product [Phaeothamnion confervicola]
MKEAEMEGREEVAVLFLVQLFSLWVFVFAFDLQLQRIFLLLQPFQCMQASTETDSRRLRWLRRRRASSCLPSFRCPRFLRSRLSACNWSGCGSLVDGALDEIGSVPCRTRRSSTGTRRGTS